MVVVVGLLDLVDEIKKIEGEYTISLAFIRIIKYASEYMQVLPIATLMGSLIGLSKLSSTSELNAIKTGGYLLQNNFLFA